MKARQLSIAPSSIYAIGMIDQLRVIGRGEDGLWGGWEPTGVSATRVAHVGEIVARIGVDGRVYALQRSPRQPWVACDLEAVELVASRSRDRAPVLFAADPAGNAHWTTKPSPIEPWRPWEPLGGPASGLAAALIPGGGFALFALREGGLVHRWQDRPGDTWHPWTPVDDAPADLSELGVTTVAGGGIALFALGADGTLHHWWQDAPFARWQRWEPLGHDLATIAVTRAARGGLAVFAADRLGQVLVRAQQRPFGDWRSWHKLGGRARRLAAQPSWTDGLEVFAVGTDDELRHAWCERLDRPWTEWRLLDYEAAPVPLPASGRPGTLPD